MTDTRFVVVATDHLLADRLLGSLPEDCDSTTELALLGHAVSDVTDAARSLPVSRVHAIEGVAPDAEPAMLAAALAPLLGPDTTLLLDSSQPSRDVAGWLSITRDAPIVWAVDAIRIAVDALEVDRVVLGGSHRLVHALPLDAASIIMLKPTASATEQGRGRSTPAEVVEAHVSLPEPRVQTDVMNPVAADGLAPLPVAKVIVSVGRGIGGADRVPLFRELAERMHAGLGASRVAVDAGWLPFAHQVGQTGTSVAPDLYLAFGISGAIQHLAGIRASKRVVAINTDREASLCRLADLVIEADATEVAERLLKRLAEAGA
jgi:electron transfer flavoprotein alpha subunit